jgi:hypothetical protein
VGKGVGFRARGDRAAGSVAVLGRSSGPR